MATLSSLGHGRRTNPATARQSAPECDTNCWYHVPLNSKQPKMLEAVFTDPIKASILWVDVEALLHSLGALMKDGGGSRIGFSLNGVDARRRTTAATASLLAAFFLVVGAWHSAPYVRAGDGIHAILEGSHLKVAQIRRARLRDFAVDTGS